MGTHCFHLNIHGLTYSFRPKVKFVKGLKPSKKERKEGKRKRRQEVQMPKDLVDSLVDVFSLWNVLPSLSSKVFRIFIISIKTAAPVEKSHVKYFQLTV